MSSSGLLIQPDRTHLLDEEHLYRLLMQVIGRDLGLEDWGSKVDHITFDSDTEYAHTIQNQGSGGHLNVPSIFSVTDAGVFTGGLTANGDVTLGDAAGDDIEINGTSVFNAVATMADALVANADVTLGNAAADTLTINATSIFNTGATFNSTLSVKGNATIGDAAGDAHVVKGTLNAQQAVDCDSTLNVDGAATFVSTVTLATNNVGLLGKTTGGAPVSLAKVDNGDILQYGESGVTGAVVDAGYVQLKSAGTVRFSVDTTGIGFFGTAPGAKPTVTGAKGGNVAVANLLTALAGLGLLVDSTT